MTAWVCPLCREMIDGDPMVAERHIRSRHSAWQVARYVWNADPPLVAAVLLGGVLVILTLSVVLASILSHLGASH